MLRGMRNHRLGKFPNLMARLLNWLNASLKITMQRIHHDGRFAYTGKENIIDLDLFYRGI